MEPVPEHLKGFISIIAAEIARQIQAENREAAAKQTSVESLKPEETCAEEKT
jgi:hypothetical protein